MAGHTPRTTQNGGVPFGFPVGFPLSHPQKRPLKNDTAPCKMVCGDTPHLNDGQRVSNFNSCPTRRRCIRIGRRVEVAAALSGSESLGRNQLRWLTAALLAAPKLQTHQNWKVSLRLNTVASWCHRSFCPSCGKAVKALSRRDVKPSKSWTSSASRGDQRGCSSAEGLG